MFTSFDNLLNGLPVELIMTVLDLLDTSSFFSLKCVSKKYACLLNVTFGDKYIKKKETLSMIITNAISNKYSKLFRWLIGSKYSLTSTDRLFYCKLAAFYGSFYILKYLYNEPNEFSGFLTNMYNSICDLMHSDNLRFLNDGPSNYKDRVPILENAAGEGHLEIIKYLFKISGNDLSCGGVQYSTNMLRVTERAAENGHVEVLKYLYRCGYRLTPSTCANAARCGQLEVVKYLYEMDRTFFWNRIEWNRMDYDREYETYKEMGVEICSIAAANGHLEVLRFLHEHKYPWDATVCAKAAAGGHLDILKYLHENKCPSQLHGDEEACIYAARNGHLEVLKYLRDTGCPCGKRTHEAAVEEDQIEILQYLQNNGFS